ncbi:DDE-type integrase/transposase/recombinase [bacterium SCSIO 12844]|nr:DDE-type integrase/transposase/recombinase [bacterium SCSIO 12844]
MSYSLSYRAVDKDGDTLEFMLSEKRDEEATFKFLKKAIGQHGLPECITIDKSSANDAAIILLNCMLHLNRNLAILLG